VLPYAPRAGRTRRARLSGAHLRPRRSWGESVTTTGFCMTWAEPRETLSSALSWSSSSSGSHLIVFNRGSPRARAITAFIDAVHSSGRDRLRRHRDLERCQERRSRHEGVVTLFTFRVPSLQADLQRGLWKPNTISHSVMELGSSPPHRPSPAPGHRASRLQADPVQAFPLRLPPMTRGRSALAAQYIAELPRDHCGSTSSASVDIPSFRNDQWRD
jgi:hypothetical protein